MLPPLLEALILLRWAVQFQRGAQFTTKGAHSVLARIWPIPNSNLRELDIGVILIGEQIGVRRILLADSPFAPIPGVCISLQAGNIFMPDFSCSH